MSKLFNTAIVEKRNILNAVRSNNMTLQELRFFSIYLSKINPWDKSTRVVRFPLDDFRRIMGLSAGENIAHFRYTIRHILQQVVEVPNEKGTGYTAFQLFKRAKVEKNTNDEWYVEFDAHDEALPLMFDFKDRYFKYELWNALRLKSPNQVRMYEILKQYEGLGKRELTVTELRELLGIGKNEYADRWDNFKKKVLDSCQQALKETTDICFTYERGKTGKGGKWLTIVFYIKKNEDYSDQLTLAEFIEMQPKPTAKLNDNPNQLDLYDIIDGKKENNSLDFLAGACDNEFSPEQMQVIFSIISTKDLPPTPNDYLSDDGTSSINFARYHYLMEQYSVLNYYAKKSEIKAENRFGYFCKMLKKDCDFLE